jgi:hypothetical protein
VYSEESELIEVLLSIILNYYKPYFCISELNRSNQLHSCLGLDGELEFPAKVGLELEVIRTMVQIECPQFAEETQHKNIGYAHLLYSFIYEMHSRNFYLQTLVEIWNFLFKEPLLIPIYALAISVWLVTFYSPKLIRCRTLQEVSAVLQSCQTCDSDTIIRDILILREKYFNSSRVSQDNLNSPGKPKPLQ